MKRIINRKSYDTETAEFVASWDNGPDRGNFRWCAEKLCVTAHGAYFLHGKGGPMSPYSRALGLNSWTGGEDIVPLTRDEAIGWLERTLNTDAIEAEFPDAIKEA